MRLERTQTGLLLMAVWLLLMGSLSLPLGLQKWGYLSSDGYQYHEQQGGIRGQAVFFWSLMLLLLLLWRHRSSCLGWYPWRCDYR
jgi:hypothetical protein